MKKLNVAANVEAFDQVWEFLEDDLNTAACSMGEQMQIRLAAEESFVNICHYGYEGSEGAVDVEAELLTDPAGLLLRFIDSGVPFNPLEQDEPDITLPGAERPIGGLGIFLTLKAMDEVSYAYEGGKNRLTMIKRFRKK